MPKENFSLTEAGRLHAKWIMFRKMLMLYLGLMTVLVLVTRLIWELSVGQWVILAVAAIVLLGVFVQRTWNNEAISFRDWGLHIDEQCVYLTGSNHRSQLGTHRIRREDVRQVIESDIGLIVKGLTADQQIWIQAGVEDYAMIRDKLDGWLTENQKRSDR
jgi:hypothetical protein